MERSPIAQPGTQAIDRAADLLALVVGSDGPRTFTSLVDETGLAKSTASRLLQALERNRLVHRDRRGAFRPGQVFTQFALRGDISDTLADLAMPTLERLGERTGETVNLAIPRSGSVITIAQVDSDYLISAMSWVGGALPVHCTSTGKVFCAYGRMPVPEGELERFTDHTITDPDRLRREFAEIRRRGYSIARDELEVGLVALGAPVTSGGDVVAALSVTGPTSRLTASRIEEDGAVLVKEAGRLSVLLGGSASG